MVQIKSSFIFLLSTASLALATPAQIENSISLISGNLTVLTNDLNALSTSNPTLAEALAINSASANLANALGAGTTAATANGPLSVADGTTILNEVSALAPTIESDLTEIVNKKPAFTTLNNEIKGILALVLEDLQSLNSTTITFSNALIAIAPSSLLPNATSLKNAIVSAFDTAIAAYS